MQGQRLSFASLCRLLGSSVQILRKFLYLTASFLHWSGSDKEKYDLETLFPLADSFREQCGPLRPLSFSAGYLLVIRSFGATGTRSSTFQINFSEDGIFPPAYPVE
jgi:hypothetical protein